MMSRVTLSHKCLAGVQENLAALHDHALNSQVLPDVLRLAHFVMHDSKNEETRHVICQQFHSINQSNLYYRFRVQDKKNKLHSHNTNKSQKSYS